MQVNEDRSKYHQAYAQSSDVLPLFSLEREGCMYFSGVNN